MAPQRFTNCLWYDGKAEEAARFYCSIFPRSSIDKIVKAPADNPSNKKGDVLTVDFTLDGQKFLALNGGPLFKFTEAVSIMVDCEDQAEVDRVWKKLSAVPEAEQCGWCKDKYGLSWQIIPRGMLKLIYDPDPARAKRGFEAMMQMKKLDLATIERAVAGQPLVAKTGRGR